MLAALTQAALSALAHGEAGDIEVRQIRACIASPSSHSFFLQAPVSSWPPVCSRRAASHAVILITVEQETAHTADCAAFASALRFLRASSDDSSVLPSSTDASLLAATTSPATSTAPCLCSKRGLSSRLRSQIALIDLAGSETLVSRSSSVTSSASGTVASPELQPKVRAKRRSPSF